MRLLPGRAEKLESAVAILILLVLIATAVGVYVIQRNADMGRFGIVSGHSSEETTAQKADKPKSSFAGLVMEDFSPAGDAETYDTDTLYEKINGKAPMYQEAGFVLLATQRFAAKSNPELGFELYQFDMGDSRNAFSVYSRQKRADVVDLNEFPKRALRFAACQFGYQTTNAVYFSYGKYYVEMIGFAESQELIEVMKGAAQKLVTQMRIDEKDKITEISLFPAEGTVAGSWKLQLRDAFGFDGLTDTYSAQYKAGDKFVTIFLSNRHNTDDARTLAKNYTDFLVTNGAKIVEPNVFDFYGSTEIVFSTGVFIGGVHEADDRQAAKKAAEALQKRLSESSGENNG